MALLFFFPQPLLRDKVTVLISEQMGNLVSFLPIHSFLTFVFSAFSLILFSQDLLSSYCFPFLSFLFSLLFP